MGRNLYRRRPPLRESPAYASSGDPATRWYQELAPGGLTNHWTGAVPRFAAEDFVEGARLHESYRWPVGYADLEPYYDRVERLLGVAGDPRSLPSLPASRVRYRRRLPADWLRMARQATAQGQGLIPTPIADGKPWLITRSPTAFNSYTVIVRTLMRHRHFRLLSGAHALRLHHDQRTGKAGSLLYFDRIAGCERTVSASAFVIAAGTLATTKLLLDSTCPAFPHGFGDTEGILGKYLHDHAQDWCELELESPLRRVEFPVCFTRRPYCDSQPLLAVQCTLVNARTTAEKIRASLPTKSHWLGVQMFGTMIPTADSYASPHQTKRDAFGLPTLNLNISYDADTRANTAAARERLVQMLESSGIRCRISFALEQPNPPGTSVHFGGTVRMHQCARYGMLNEWNRLHRVDNVAVVDASCFTTGVEKNPTLTEMALAARAADRLACDLKAS